MKIVLKFKHLPSGGKYIKNGRYYVAYNTKGSYWAEGNEVRNYRLPKFIWDKI